MKIDIKEVAIPVNVGQVIRIFEITKSPYGIDHIGSWVSERPDYYFGNKYGVNTTIAIKGCGFLHFNIPDHLKIVGAFKIRTIKPKKRPNN